MSVATVITASARRRRLRERLALRIAPWLERPDPFDRVDFRDAGPMVETAAIIGGQVWVREMLSRGLPVAEYVTVFYVPVTGLDRDGNGYRVTSVCRNEEGVATAGVR